MAPSVNMAYCYCYGLWFPTRGQGPSIAGVHPVTDCYFSCLLEMQGYPSSHQTVEGGNTIGDEALGICVSNWYCSEAQRYLVPLDLTTNKFSNDVDVLE